MPAPHVIVSAAVLVFVTVVALTDLATHRIPNRLTVPAALVAVTINSIIGGVAGAVSSVAGLGVGLAILLPLFLLARFGAGDVKAIAAVGAFLGPHGILETVLCTLLAGALCGVLILVARGGWVALRSMVRRWTFRAYVLCTTGGTAHVSAPDGDASRARFPYGLAIALGTATALLWSHHGG